MQHQHRRRAYCGITWFDSDAYPEEYRKVFYMGNIHGGCINADITEPHGSTYKGKPHPGFTPKPEPSKGMSSTPPARPAMRRTPSWPIC